MKTYSSVVVILSVLITITFTRCTSSESEAAISSVPTGTATTADNFGGFESRVKWGEHLVTIGGCNDCHTPKKMTPIGPDNDSSLMLSGHPANMPPPDVDRREMESKGIGASNTLTAWVGPWGISYAANLTSDSTGIGNWTEDQFLLCIRQGKWKGLATGRQLLPPMPWPGLAKLRDDELKAVFAYLKSTKPIRNVVPSAAAPVLMAGR